MPRLIPGWYQTLGQVESHESNRGFNSILVGGSTVHGGTDGDPENNGRGLQASAECSNLVTPNGFQPLCTGSGGGREVDSRVYIERGREIKEKRVSHMHSNQSQSITERIASLLFQNNNGIYFALHAYLIQTSGRFAG
jgi:hypothetical protein